MTVLADNLVAFAFEPEIGRCLHCWKVVVHNYVLSNWTGQAVYRTTEADRDQSCYRGLGSGCAIPSFDCYVFRKLLSKLKQSMLQEVSLPKRSYKKQRITA